MCSPCYHMDNYEQWHRHRTIWISLPSVRRSRHCALKPLLVARQCARNVQCAMCNVQCAHYSSSNTAAAQMEPPRMISGLHNAVSRTKSANHGWLSHPWPKCGWCDNFSKLEFISHGLFCLERLLQAFEGSDGKYSDQSKVQGWISSTLSETKINVQIWKPPIAIASDEKLPSKLELIVVLKHNFYQKICYSSCFVDLLDLGKISPYLGLPATSSIQNTQKAFLLFNNTCS